MIKHPSCPGDDLLWMLEVAKELKTSKQTVYKLLMDLQCLPYEVRDGGYMVVRRCILDQFIKQSAESQKVLDDRRALRHRAR